MTELAEAEARRPLSGRLGAMTAFGIVRLKRDRSLSFVTLLRWGRGWPEADNAQFW